MHQWSHINMDTTHSHIKYECTYTYMYLYTWSGTEMHAHTFSFLYLYGSPKEYSLCPCVSRAPVSSVQSPANSNFS
jgi:hypothetical protein